MISQKDVDELEKTFITKFDLKEALVQLKSDIFDKLDAFVKEVRDSHEERLLVSHKLSEIEDRVEKLESTQTN
jgi:hypothetical protein